MKKVGLKRLILWISGLCLFFPFVCVAQPSHIIRVLAIDGGGIRGIISAYVLAYLEAKTGRPINQLFDVVVGTSTGALQASLLAASDEKTGHILSGQELISFYNHEMPALLKTSWYDKLRTLNGLIGPRFDGNVIYQAISQGAGDQYLSQTRYRLIIPTFNISTGDAFIFDSQEAKVNPQVDYKLKDVIYSAIAVPAYIAPRVITSKISNKKMLVDGSLVAVNPVILGLNAARFEYPHSPVMIVSLGTGKSPQTLSFKTAEHGGMLEWFEPVLNMILGGHASLNQYEVKSVEQHRLLNFTDYYINIQIPLDQSSLFDVTPAHLALLNEYGRQIVKMHQAELDQIAVELTKDH